MKKTKIIIITGILAVAALVGLLASRQRQAPLFPQDPTHARFVDGESCMACHGPQGTSPRGKNHPIGNDCTRCHGRD